MKSTANFLVNPRLARLLGETYRSSEAALKELVDNAWDADATEVSISIPKPLSKEPIVVLDNGSGMSEEQLRSGYLDIARDKRRTQGEKTPRFGRKVKGRKGIGKFAGLTVATEMTLMTSTQQTICSLFIDKHKLVSSQSDLETVPLDLEVSNQNGTPTGTTITLSSLEQSLNFPRPEFLKQLLFREYGHDENFKILVDGEVVGFTDLVGSHFQKDITSLGEPTEEKARLSFTVTSDKSKPKSPGISLRIDGKIVGIPSYFGLDEDPEIPDKLLKSVIGEINVPDTPGLVTADWGSVNESSKAYEAISESVRDEVKKKLTQTHKKQISAQKARLQKQIDARLAKLPENRREFAAKALQRILNKFYDETDEKVTVIIGVALNALELDEYWAVLEKINLASKGTVVDFADALADFGLLELANLGQQARNRDLFLTHLQHLANSSDTIEETMHKALEQNLWVFGLHRTLISSNQALKTLVSNYLNKKYSGKNSDKRPDLFLGEAIGGDYLLIEFKRPNKVIGRAEISQAENYRDDLQAELASDATIEVIVVGKKRDPIVRPDHLASNLRVEGYDSVISRSRTEIGWLLKQLH